MEVKYSIIAYLISLQEGGKGKVGGKALREQAASLERGE